MKKRFSSLTIYTFLLISFTFVTANIRDGVASFPAVAQEHSNWCWAGSSQAMLYYYGTSVSQCDIANWASSRSDCCGNTDFYWDHPCNQARGMYGSDGSHQAIMSHWGVDSISHAYALSSSTVISEIDANRPFVIRFGLTFGGGHFLDGYGYGYTSESNPKQYIYYMNPWPGQGYTMTLYSTVVSAWDHTWTHSLLTYHNSIESVLVKGKACPFFASSPSAQVYGDTYAANKPVEIIIEAGVKTIDIETSGKIANCDGCYGTNIMTPVDDYEKYGISLITAPINSLIGVFLNNNNPSYYDTPSRLTNYGSHADNTPKLQQAFFIYHFYTSISSLSTIQVPEGATRLYLGGLDGYGWNDNTDNYSVKLTLANSGCTTYSGTLSTEQMEQQPNGTYYLSNASGTHKGILSGPSGMDFDLRLYKWNGTYWDVAGKGITLSSNETVSVYGSAGYYTWVVNAYSGSGSYSLCISHP